MKRLSQAQMESENGRIYGRAPIPGARYEVGGVYYDSRGYECALPGAKKAEPEPEPVKEPEREPTENELRLAQFQEYLDSITDDDQKDELRSWMETNVGSKYHPNIGLAKLKKQALEDFTALLDGNKEAA